MFFLRAAVVKQAEKQSKTESEQESGKANLIRPSDLPLYTPLHSQQPPKELAHPNRTPSVVRETLEGGIGTVRKEVQNGWNTVAQETKILSDYYDTAKAHSMSTIDYLNQPNNILPRSGAIAIGGLSGFILSVRGGFIKKVLYTTIGAGFMASLCYPRQANQFAQEVLFEARKGYAICYNFIKGVKPGDEIPVEPINKFPTTLEDVKFLVLDLYDEAKEALLSKKK